MQELIQKIAENKELQAQLKGCKDAKAAAQLLGIDEAQAEKFFPKMKEFLENGTLPDELLEKAAGGIFDPTGGGVITEEPKPYGGATGGF